MASKRKAIIQVKKGTKAPTVVRPDRLTKQTRKFDAELRKKRVSTPSAKERDRETDLLIIGMGFAGLCAANRAIDQGVKVTLIDKLPRGYYVPGGAMILSSQAIHICDMSLMEKEEDLCKAIMKNTALRAPNAMASTLVGNARRSLEWLKGCGVEFEEPAGKELMLSPKKENVTNNTTWGFIKPGGKFDATRYGGKTNSETLLNRVIQAGADVEFEASAQELLTDDRGAVVGARVRSKRGGFTIRAAGTVLCTGTFNYNPEMMTRWFGPHASEVLPYGSPGATGDGLEMALRIRAGFRFPGTAGGFRTVPEEAIWNQDLLYNNLERLAYHGVYVNEYGNRMMDESLFSEMKIINAELAKHSESITGMVLIDDALYQKNPSIKAVVDGVLEFGGAVYRADTIEKIAEMAQSDERLGIRLGKQQNLVKTVRGFNRAVSEHSNMELDPPRRGNLNALETPPLYAIPTTLTNIGTGGGLLVNEKGEVKDKDGNVIPGLYAAGVIMHNSIGGGPNNTPGHNVAYVGNLAVCLIFGVICGETAAARARRVQTGLN